MSSHIRLLADAALHSGGRTRKTRVVGIVVRPERWRKICQDHNMRRIDSSTLARVLVTSMVFFTSAPAQGEESTASAEIVPHECLLIKSVGRYGRSLIQLDAVQAQIVAGRWKTPRAGDSVTLPNGNTQI